MICDRVMYYTLFLPLHKKQFSVRTVSLCIETEGRRCEECIPKTLAATSFLFLLLDCLLVDQG